MVIGNLRAVCGLLCVACAAGAGSESGAARQTLPSLHSRQLALNCHPLTAAAQILIIMSDSYYFTLYCLLRACFQPPLSRVSARRLSGSAQPSAVAGVSTRAGSVCFLLLSCLRCFGIALRMACCCWPVACCRPSGSAACSPSQPMARLPPLYTHTHTSRFILSRSWARADC